MFTENDVKLMAKLIRGRVGFFNGWAVDGETEQTACEKAAKDVVEFISEMKNAKDMAASEVEQRLQKFVEERTWKD